MEWLELGARKQEVRPVAMWVAGKQIGPITQYSPMHAAWNWIITRIGTSAHVDMVCWHHRQLLYLSGHIMIVNVNCVFFKKI